MNEDLNYLSIAIPWQNNFVYIFKVAVHGINFKLSMKGCKEKSAYKKAVKTAFELGKNVIFEI